ncbi:MAG: DUF4258 domain-containing protein [bacterium]
MTSQELLPFYKKKCKLKIMADADIVDPAAIFKKIRIQAKEENVYITQHAQQEMVEEDITLDEVLEAVSVGQVLENYPEHKRGACCLVNGFTNDGRPIHIVCTTAKPMLIIITVYEPKPPKWATPTQRRR